MDRQLMLQEIQEKIADKTLSFWCNIIRINWIEETVVKFDAKWDWSFYLVTLCSSVNTHYWVSLSLSDVENIIIIWHPISLSRVLSALGHWYWYDFSNQMIMFMKDSFIDGIYWYLLKEDKSDAMLDDQSDETIEALHPERGASADPFAQPGHE